MRRITRTEEANEDLIDIWLYIARRSPVNADCFIDRIEQKLGLLADNPRIGQLRDEFAPNLRSFPVGDT